MSGTNAGTGQPLSFRCAKCRIGAQYGMSRRGWNVELTGRTREVGRGGVRMDRIAREYRCLDCKHVGWSRHYDLPRLARHVATR